MTVYESSIYLTISIGITSKEAKMSTLKLMAR